MRSAASVDLGSNQTLMVAEMMEGNSANATMTLSSENLVCRRPVRRERAGSALWSVHQAWVTALARQLPLDQASAAQ